MSLKDQLDKIKKTDHGYEVTIDGLYSLYASLSLMVYYVYVSENVITEVYGDENIMAAALDAAYAEISQQDVKSASEQDFMADYEYFVLSSDSAK